MEEYKKAALNMYPEKWKEFENGVRVDQNANIRAVAEGFFKRVSESLPFDENLDLGVASAFLHRMAQYRPTCEHDKNK